MYFHTTVYVGLDLDCRLLTVGNTLKLALARITTSMSAMLVLPSIIVGPTVGFRSRMEAHFMFPGGPYPFFSALSL